MSAINLEMAWQFLEALAPDGCWTFQTFDDSEHKRTRLIRILHCVGGRFLDVAPTLAELNDQGAGVFLMVNRGNMHGRRAEHVIRLRALFVDADNVPFPATFHRNPDIFVCRDETHWHAYWKIPPETPLAEFTPAQKKLARFYGTDPAVHDLPRVMRVPGFIHRKNVPVMVRLEVAA